MDTETEGIYHQQSKWRKGRENTRKEETKKITAKMTAKLPLYAHQNLTLFIPP